MAVTYAANAVIISYLQRNIEPSPIALEIYE